MLPEVRAARNKARWDIIQATNRHVMRMAVHPLRSPKLRGMRDIQRCAHHARKFNLVKPDVLIKAGFNP